VTFLLSELQMGRFLRPLTYGQYPAEMLEDVNIRLREFTPEESEKLRKSLDFVGLNYYGAFFSTPLAKVNSSQLNYETDLRVNWTGTITLTVFKKFLSK